jgi:hypothetical protein
VLLGSPIRTWVCSTRDWRLNGSAITLPRLEVRLSTFGFLKLTFVLGDPSRIVLFGESAGGGSVDMYSYGELADEHSAAGC